tara:strand:- start:1934 stop:2143 length:210 start_codon:yes stop_codon:yes gene_type:complete
MSSEAIVHTHGQNLMVQLYQLTIDDNQKLQDDVDRVKNVLRDANFYIFDAPGLFHFNTFLAIFPENLEE